MGASNPAVGNVKTINESDYNQTLGYDALDRLTSASGVYGAKTNTYDAIGNILTKDGRTHAYFTNASGWNTHKIGYDGLYTYVYDANGNILNRKVETAVERSFVYNNDNRVEQVKNGANVVLQANTYDGDGQVVKQVEGGKTRYRVNAYYEREVGGYGLDFDGMDDYVLIPDSASNGDFNAAITLEAWIKPKEYNPSAYSCIVTKHGAYYLNLDTAGKLQFYWYGLSNPGYHKSPSAIPTGKWTHVAATYKGSSVRLYVNGVDVGAVQTSGNGATTIYRVGIGREPKSATRHFNGMIDEVRILNRALSAGEILEDYSLRGYTVDRSGAAWVAGVSGSGSTANIIKYYYAGGQRIALQDSAGLKYIHTDHLNSTSRMSNALGNAIRELHYDPWGRWRPTRVDRGCAIPTPGRGRR